MTTLRAVRLGVVVGRPSSGEEWLATARSTQALGYDTLTGDTDAMAASLLDLPRRPGV